MQKLNGFSFNHSDQIDRLYEIMTTTQMKQLFDSRGEELRTALNKLINDLETEVGASNIGMTPITALGLHSNVKDIINRIIEILKSTTDGISGADFISATPIAELEGVTVQALLESLKKFIDDYKNELNSNDGASKIKTTNGNTVQTEINNAKNMATSAATIGDQARTIAQTAMNQVSNIISNAPANKDAELVDIRYDALNNQQYPTAGKRIDNITLQLAENVQEITTVKTNYAKKTDVNDLANEKANLVDVKTSDANLQSQINTIVLNGTSGDSSAEVAQARVSANGSTYSTLKGNLDNIESIIATGKAKYRFGTWEQGGLINGVDNNDALALPIRIRTRKISIPDFIPLYNGVFIVNIATGYSAGFTFYSDIECTNMIYTTGWVTGTFNVTKKSNYMRIDMKENTDANINASQGSDLIYIDYEYGSYLINDNNISNRSTYSSDKLKNYLVDAIDIYGNKSTTQTEENRHILRVNDLEKSVNLKNVSIDDNGNMSAEIVNTNVWAEFYTEKDTVKLDVAINNDRGWIMYNKTGSTILMMPLLGEEKGCQYTLTEGTLNSTKSDLPIVPIGDLWDTATNSTVFTIEKIGSTLNIYMGEGVGSTLIATLSNCNVIGFIASSFYPPTLTTCYVTITQPKVLVKGIYQRVYELENQFKTGSADTLAERFKTMKVMISGDSITEVNFRASTNWVGYINSWLGFATCINDGKSGTGLVRPNSPHKALIDRIDDWGTDYGLILIMGNMNDYSGLTFTESNLGTISDTTISTQYGALNVTIQKLINKYPNASIGWIISTPRQYQGKYESNTTVSSDGYLWGKNSVFENASKAIKEVCEKYSIPCLDLFHESGLRPWNATNREKYFSCTQAPDGDGVHPNDLGHKLIAYKIYEFIKQYM